MVSGEENEMSGHISEVMAVDKENLAQKKSLRLVSLFSGCGGIDLGFEGDFDVLKMSINLQINSGWSTKDVDNDWVHLEIIGGACQ